MPFQAFLVTQNWIDLIQNVYRVIGLISVRCIYICIQITFGGANLGYPSLQIYLSVTVFNAAFDNITSAVNIWVNNSPCDYAYLLNCIVSSLI